MSSIFISYSHTDQAFVEKLAGDLSSRDHEVFTWEELVPGQVYPKQIETWMDSAAVYLPVITKAYMASPVAQDELDRLRVKAMDGGKTLIPIWLEPAELPTWLAEIYSIDFRNYPAGLLKLLDRVHVIDTGMGAEASAKPSSKGTTPPSRAKTGKRASGTASTSVASSISGVNPSRQAADALPPFFYSAEAAAVMKIATVIAAVEGGEREPLTTEHLAWAMLERGKGSTSTDRAPRFAFKHGLSDTRYRDLLRKRFPAFAELSNFAGTEGTRNYHPDTTKMLRAAREMARITGGGEEIGSRHLLAALLVVRTERRSPPPFAALLRQFGLSATEFARQYAGFLARSSPGYRTAWTALLAEEWTLDKLENFRVPLQPDTPAPRQGQAPMESATGQPSTSLHATPSADPPQSATPSTTEQPLSAAELALEDTTDQATQAPPDALAPDPVASAAGTPSAVTASDTPAEDAASADPVASPGQPLTTLSDTSAADATEELAQTSSSTAPVEEVTFAEASTSDQPTSDDQLGFAPYVNAVAAFLKNVGTLPPLTLSIEGEWGSGKSSFMRQLQKRIETPPDAYEPPRPFAQRVIDSVSGWWREVWAPAFGAASIVQRGMRNARSKLPRSRSAMRPPRKAAVKPPNAPEPPRPLLLKRVAASVASWWRDLWAPAFGLAAIADEHVRMLLKLPPRHASAVTERPKDPNVVTVWFNPWRHDKEEAVWAAFALEFLRGVAAKLPLTERWRGHWKLLWTRFSWRDGWLDALRALGAGAAALVLVVVLIYATVTTNLLDAFATTLAGKTQAKPAASTNASPRRAHPASPAPAQPRTGTVAAAPATAAPAGGGEKKDDAEKSILLFLLQMGGFGASVAVAVSFLKQAKAFVGNPLRFDLKKYVRSPDYQSRISFIEHFHEDFGRIVKSYVGDRRVYVFVDDLDRCEVPKAADLMQALNLMMGVEEQPIFFILGMDREKIAASLAVKFRELLPYVTAEPTTGGIPAESDTALRGLEYGSNFIEKFVQVAFMIPQPRHEDVDRLLTSMSENVTARRENAKGGLLLATAAEAGRTPDQQRIHVPDLIVVGEPGAEAAGKADAQAEQHEEREPQQQEVVEQQDQEKGQVAESTNAEAQAQQQAAEAEVAVDSPRLRRIALVVAPALEHNPRRVKQFVNVFRLRAYIATRTELVKKDGPPASGDLTFEKLGKLVAISLRWPLLLAELQDNPLLLDELQKSALRNPALTPGHWTNRTRLMDLLRAGIVDDDQIAIPGGADLWSLEGIDVDVLLQVAAPPARRAPDGTDAPPAQSAPAPDRRAVAAA